MPQSKCKFSRYADAQKVEKYRSCTHTEMPMRDKKTPNVILAHARGARRLSRPERQKGGLPCILVTVSGVGG